MQSDVFLRNMLDNLCKKVITDLAIPFARDNLLELVYNLDSNARNKSERKISGKGAARAGKGFTLFISNEDMNDIIKITRRFKRVN